MFYKVKGNKTQADPMKPNEKCLRHIRQKKKKTKQPLKNYENNKTLIEKWILGDHG